jgi:hypothetical protein
MPAVARQPSRLTRVRLSLSSVGDFRPGGASQIAVGGAMIAWVVVGTADTDLATTRLALWTEGGAGPGLVDGFAQPDFVALSGGWLVWDATINDVVGHPAGMYGVPVAAVGA